MVIGPVSGGSFNPARSITPALFAPSSPHLWIYLVGPFAGAIVGGFVYWLMRDHAIDEMAVKTTAAESE